MHTHTVLTRGDAARVRCARILLRNIRRTWRLFLLEGRKGRDREGGGWAETSLGDSVTPMGGGPLTQAPGAIYPHPSSSFLHSA